LFIISLSLLCGEQKDRIRRVKYWEIIADNLSKAGWSWGWVSALDCEGCTIWIVDAHRHRKRFVVRADEKLTAFVELEAAMQLRRLSGSHKLTNVSHDLWHEKPLIVCKIIQNTQHNT
jgi:hypothetical protein